MARKIIIDTDPGQDDAVALLLALASPEDFDVLGIVAVAGNVSLAQNARNALKVVELSGRTDVPVHAGCERPLRRHLVTAEHVHGDTGLNGPGLPEPTLELRPQHGVDFIIETLLAHEPGTVTLCTLGPLTNIAIALAKAPWLAGRISRCFIMGGASDNYGNITPVSEYNIWADPEAAEAVFASGMPITMIGWDISRKYAVIDDAEAASLRQIGTPQAHAAVDCQATLRRFCQDTGLAGFDLPDPIAVAVALDDSVATQSFEAAVFVSTHDGLTRGQTILDDRAMTERPPTVRVVSAASRERFMAVLRQGLS